MEIFAFLMAVHLNFGNIPVSVVKELLNSMSNLIIQAIFNILRTVDNDNKEKPCQLFFNADIF